MQIASSALGALLGCSGCLVAPLCEEKVPLVLVDEGWTLLPPEADPFVDGDPTTFFADPESSLSEDPRPRRCTETEVGPNLLGQEPVLDVDTGRCGWATVSQRLREDVRPDDKLGLRIFYFSQAVFDAAEAHVVVRIGEDDLLDERVPLPTTSGLLGFEETAALSADTGETVLWHVGNHGDNTWNFIELSVLRSVACPADAGSSS